MLKTFKKLCDYDIYFKNKELEGVVALKVGYLPHFGKHFGVEQTIYCMYALQFYEFVYDFWRNTVKNRHATFQMSVHIPEEL